MIKQSRSRAYQAIGIAICASIALLKIHCGDDDDDSTSANNIGCEKDCAREYLDSFGSCEEAMVDCLEGCAGPNDATCIWDCEDLDEDCQMSLSSCMADCPCRKEMQSCLADCDDDDVDCFTDCTTAYGECAGADSAYNCVLECQSDQQDCNDDCEDDSSGMGDYLNCRANCFKDEVDCVTACS